MASGMERKATATVKKIPSKPVGNVEGNILKKKRRFRGKKKSGPLEPIANFKPPKDAVSSNWQAFLASGLLQTSKKSKRKTKELTEDVESSNITKNQNGIVLKKHPNTKATETTEPPPQLDDTDDDYIKELIPKSAEGNKELTKCIAVDCEMVGVDDGRESILARISLVNQHGECVYDKFVKPKEKVVDYRTHVSGVRPTDLKRGEEFETVQKEVAKILKGRILVGHALRNDMKVLMISHPPKMIRDTSRFRLFRNVTEGRAPSLKKLASAILGVNIQSGEHSSVEDAKATMQLYNLYQKEWEGHRQMLRDRRKKNAFVKEKEQSKPSKLKKKEPANSVQNLLKDEFAAF